MRAGEDEPHVFLNTLEKLMKDWPGGLYIFMKITPIFPGELPILDIGYKYNSRKILGFIATEGGGSTESGDPCLSFSLVFFLMFLFSPLFILTY